MKRRADFSVVVLAGGEGSRLGGGKPLRLLGGTTLVERALLAANQWSDDVVLAVRAPGQAGNSAARELADDPTLSGPLAGLAAGLRYASETGRTGLLTVPCDMPFLPADLPSRLKSSWSDDSSAVVASSGGHLHPVCALWSTGVAEDLPAYLGSGRRSLKGFAEHVGFVTVEWPTHPHDPFFNINGPGDLERAEALLAG